MTSACSCGGSPCGELPPGDSVVSEAVRLLLELGLSNGDEPSSLTSARQGQRSRASVKPASAEAAQALDALFADAVAAAACLTRHAYTAESKQGEERLDKVWLYAVWRAHVKQHSDLQTACFSRQASTCREQQLLILQSLTSGLLQAAEHLAGQVAGVSAGEKRGGKAAHATTGGNAVKEVTHAAVEAELGTSAARQRGKATKARDSVKLRQTNFLGEPLLSAAEKLSTGLTGHPAASVALTVLDAQLCCWLLHQVQQHLLLLEQQATSVEGRLKRISRLLLKVLATLPLPPLLQPARTSGSNTTACPVACRCWRELPETQLQGQQHAKQQECVESRVALCIARRTLGGLAAAAPAATATATRTKATTESGPEQSLAARVRRFAAFTALELPCSALVAAVLQPQQHEKQEDLMLIDCSLEPCIRILMGVEGREGEAAVGAAADCVRWAFASLGDLALKLSSLRQLLGGGWWQPPQPSAEQGFLLRLLQLLTQTPSATLPVSSLFVQVALDVGGAGEQGLDQREPRVLRPHRCRPLVISLLLQLLNPERDGSPTAAALKLLQCRRSAAAAPVDAAVICEAFERLPLAAKFALLRALLLQQRLAGGNAKDCKGQRRQPQCETGGWQEHEGAMDACTSCCTYSSPVGQQQLQEQLLHSIFALRRKGLLEEEGSTLLLLHLWLEQAPRVPLLQVLERQQQLQLVAEAAMRCWQHPRRAVYSAARGVWTLLQQRCSEGTLIATQCNNGCSGSSSGGSSSSSELGVRLLERLCVGLFALPAASRKALYQALACFVPALGASRLLQLQPFLLPHLLSQMQNKSLRAAALLVLRAVCEQLSEDDTHQQNAEGGSKSHSRQQQKRQLNRQKQPSRRLRAFLLRPLLKALSNEASYTAEEFAEREQQYVRHEDREYPLLLPLSNPPAAESPPALALAETVLPLLLRLDPSTAAPLLVALSVQASLEAVEAAAGDDAAAADAADKTGGSAGEALRQSSLTAPLAAWVPWTAGEAALLAAARSAGLATWEPFDQALCYVSGCCCGSRSNPTSCHCADREKPSEKTPRFLVVRGCTSTGVPLCYSVSVQRIRRGLSSGDKYLRLLLLEALTLHPQTTAAPQCEELQLLAHAARQQLRLGSAGERSQFVAAFERVFTRGRNANRLSLAASDTAALRDLADKGCCCCDRLREHPRFVQHEALQRSVTCRGSLGCLLFFLKTLHASCLSTCYPEAPPDRVLVALSILTALHTVWGPEDTSKQNRKKSPFVQVAAAVSAKAAMVNMAADGTPMNNTGRECAVAESLGWDSWAVRSKLHSLLFVVAGPAPRKLVTQLLLQLQQRGSNCLTTRGQSERQLLMPLGITPGERIRRSVLDACIMLTSLREETCSAGAVHLHLLLHELFASPLEALADSLRQPLQPSLTVLEQAEGAADLQTIFCAALREELCRQLPQAIKGADLINNAQGASPSERARQGRSPPWNDCFCHPARGLLTVLTILTEAAESRLNEARKDLAALGESKMGLHGVLSALERALSIVTSNILALPCYVQQANKIKSSSWEQGGLLPCSAAVSAWRTWRTRLVSLLQDTCRCMTCFAAAADEDDTPEQTEEDKGAVAEKMGNGVLRETADEATEQQGACGGTNSSTPSPGTLRGQLQVDCRGHPYFPQEHGAGREEAQQLLAFCSWRAVQAATGCLAALWKASAFDEDLELGEHAEQPSGVSAAVTGNVAAVSLRTQQTEASAPTFAASSRAATAQTTTAASPAADKSSIQQKNSTYDQWLLRVHQQPLLRFRVKELVGLANGLISCLLSCRHMGAVEFLHQALATLCFRVRTAVGEEVRGLNRRWADSILVLFIPTSASAAKPDGSCRREPPRPQQQQQLNDQQNSLDDELFGAATSTQASICRFLEVLGLPVSVCAGATALPPPLRKSKSLGLAMTAILGLGQANMDSGFDSALLLHVLSFLLPLAEGRVPRLFFSQQEAFAAQVHAINLLRSLITASTTAAAIDVGQAAALADAAVVAAATVAGAPPLRPEGFGSHITRKFEGREPRGSALGEADTSGTRMPLAIATLAIAIKATASKEFPVRTAANSLLVAATKRLAGADDETQRVPTEPFAFCSGAAARGSTGSASGLLCIDAACLSLPHVQPLIAMALLPLLNKIERPSTQTLLPGETHCLSEQRHHQQRVVQRGTELLLRGLAAHGPFAVAELISAKLKKGTDHDLMNVAQEEVNGLQEEAAVAVLLLLARADLSTLSPIRPPISTLLYDCSVEEVVSQLRAVAGQSAACFGSGDEGGEAASARQQAECTKGSTGEANIWGLRWGVKWGVARPHSAQGGSTLWLQLLLRSLCCCLRSEVFAARALAARALASYIIQLALADGVYCFFEAAAATAAAALQAYESATLGGNFSPEDRGHTPARSNVSASIDDASSSQTSGLWQDANARSGLQLLLVELLGRPEASRFLAENPRSTDVARAAKQLQDGAMQLLSVGLSPVSTVEKLLLLQVGHSLAMILPAAHSDGLWSLVGSVCNAAIEMTQENGKIAKLVVAEPAVGKDSLAYWCGLAGLQGVALRVLVEYHLRHPKEAIASESTSAGSQAHLEGLRKVDGVLHAALARAVHPQAVEAALRALTKATSRFSKSQRQSVRLRLAGGGSSEAPAIIQATRPESFEAVVSEQLRKSFFSLWELCLHLLQSPLAATPSSPFLGSKGFWQLCFIAPLQIAACRALAALSEFAASHEALCQQVCWEKSKETAAAAAALSQADFGNESARAARVRLGAALLLCAENEERRHFQKMVKLQNHSADEAAAETSTGGLGVCFELAAMDWAAPWSSALLFSAQSTQKLETRAKAAKALCISGLPGPCSAGQCSGTICAKAKLRVWRAALLLLQDEDVWVRETVGTAASGAAGELYYRLYSAPGLTCSTVQATGAQLLLTAVASPAFGEEPHGVESGAVVQVLLDLISELFPPATTCTFLWQRLRQSCTAAMEKCAGRCGFSLSDGSISASAAKTPHGGNIGCLFDEEPPNLYADPALAAQITARSLVQTLLSRQGDLSAEISTGLHACSVHVSTKCPVRSAIVEATRRTASKRGAGAAALADLTAHIGCTNRQSRWSQKRSEDNGTVAQSSWAGLSRSWLVQATHRTASDLQVLRASLEAMTFAEPLGGGSGVTRAEQGSRCGGELLLHPTQNWHFLPTHMSLLCSWFLVIAWVSNKIPLTHKAVANMFEASKGLLSLLQRAASSGRMPFPQILVAVEALVEVISYVITCGSTSCETGRIKSQDVSSLNCAALNSEVLPSEDFVKGQGERTTKEADLPSAATEACNVSSCAAAAAQRLACACLFLLAEER
ncbi:hypothetical protein Esti_000858 [Eimeria stiedai]